MPRSSLLDKVARRVGAPEGLRLRRTRAGHWQRAQGAWSWWAEDEQGREVLASHHPLSELVKCPGLTATAQDRHPQGALEVDPAYCQSCRKREAVHAYDPYVAEIHEDQDPTALLCGECFQERADDI